MTIKNFKKIGRLLKEVYKELEQVALETGINLMSQEYEDMVYAVREKTLDKFGFSVEEYEKAKNEFLALSSKEIDNLVKDTIASDELLELRTKISEIKIPKIPSKQEIQEFAREIAEEYIKEPQIINQIVERIEIEKPTIVKETLIQREEYDSTEIDNKVLNVLEKVGLIEDKVSEIKNIKPVDVDEIKKDLKGYFSEDLKKNINLMGMPDFRKLAMGMQEQIDNLAAGESPTPGLQYKIFVTVGSSDADYLTGDYASDGLAVQAAYNYLNGIGGGHIFVKAGSYTVQSPITVYGNIYLQGAGIGITKFLGGASLGTNAVFQSFNSIGSPITDAQFSDFTIDGSSMPTSPVSTFRKGFYLTYTLRLLIQNVRVYKTPATGFGPDYNVDMRIINCVADECGTLNQNPGYNGFGFGTGVYAKETTLVSNCIARNCLNNGFLLEYVDGGLNSTGFEFVNCFAIANKRGFRVSGASNASFINCEAYDNTFNGFYFQLFGAALASPENIKVKGCSAYNNGDDGFYFKEQEDTQINLIFEGNHAYSNAGYGMISGGNYAQIKNNFAWLNDKTGIFYHGNSADNRTNVQITGNTCYNNGQLGTPAYSDGIRIWGELGNITGAIISNNICFDNQGVKTQEYGIAVKDNVDEILVQNNDCRGNKTDAILNDTTTTPTNNVFLNNKGWNPTQVYVQGNVTGATTFTRVNGDFITATLTGNITVTLTSGNNIGDELVLLLTQDATGSRTVTWPSNFKKTGGTLTLTTTASAIDQIRMKWDGTNWREITRSMNQS